jgi:hypothetical protein
MEELDVLTLSLPSVGYIRIMTHQYQQATLGIENSKYLGNRTIKPALRG